jgi:hypothetical protein
MSKCFVLAGLFVIFAGLGVAQSEAPLVAPQDNQDNKDAGAQPPTPPGEDKHIFGVIPNHRTTEAALPFQRLSAAQKLTIAAKDSFDWPTYVTGAAFAGLYQIENQNPSFGQGAAGYARRFGTGVADQAIGNMMTEGFVPALFHQDPRYFRLGEGTRLHRLLYSLEQIVVAPMDSGRRTFNFSEWGGNAAGTAISNLYYPDSRDFSDNLTKWLSAVGTDTLSNIAKEFWPDVKRYLHNRHERKEQQRAQQSQP